LDRVTLPCVNARLPRSRDGLVVTNWVGAVQSAAMDTESDPYNAYEKWDYHQIIFLPENQEQSWLSMSESFYRASKHLVEGVVNRSLLEDVEGRAALFLFRHYLELALKKIIVAGCCLTKEGGLTKEEVKPIKKGHDLILLWEQALVDAKPKMPKAAPWETYDWKFAEKCIKEFGAADVKGFAFRYHGEGGERAHVDFEQLLAAMEHIYQVLEATFTFCKWNTLPPRRR